MKVVGVDIDQEKQKSVREENLVDDSLVFGRAGDVEATSSLFVFRKETAHCIGFCQLVDHMFFCNAITTHWRDCTEERLI